MDLSASTCDPEELHEAWCEGRRVLRVKSLEGFRDNLRERRWEFINDGDYSAVYKRGDLVWRYSTGYTGDAYRYYAWSILQGFLGSSPHLPRLHLMIMDDDGRFAVLMERLSTTLRDYRQIDGLGVRNHLQTLRDSVRAADEAEISAIMPLARIGAKLKAWFLDTDLASFFDLHDRNWMLRRDGCVVLTDPIA